MNEKRKEVKRTGRKVAITIYRATWCVFGVILLFCLFQTIITLSDLSKAIEVLGISDFISLNNGIITINPNHAPTMLEGEYVWNSFYVAEIKIRISSANRLKDIRFEITTLGQVIFILIGVLTTYSGLLICFFLPEDCHYLILWKEVDNYFSVSFPQVKELETPLQLHRKFSMKVEKRNIQINDGITTLNLPYDKNAEQVLRRLQK